MKIEFAQGDDTYEARFAPRPCDFCQERPVHLIGMCKPCLDIYMESWLGSDVRAQSMIQGSYWPREPAVKCWLREPGAKT